MPVWLMIVIAGDRSWYSTGFMPLGALLLGMRLEETVDYLAEELDLERSTHVRAVGRSVAELRD
jgi:hypothetical protein